jgi:putative ABC transport system ATP-binding protein
VAGEASTRPVEEPTGNLDSARGELVMELLHEPHRGGTAICMVTHDAR